MHTAGDSNAYFLGYSAVSAEALPERKRQAEAQGSADVKMDIPEPDWAASDSVDSSALTGEDPGMAEEGQEPVEAQVAMADSPGRPENADW